MTHLFKVTEMKCKYKNMCLHKFSPIQSDLTKYPLMQKVGLYN